VSTPENGRPLVLIADDDADIRELVGFRLECAGCKVIRAADGEEALRLAGEKPPDICVLDVMMPKLDGLGVTRALRRLSATESVPVLLLTARAADDDIARGMEAGADGYLRKPFSPQELADRVEQVLGRGRTRPHSPAE
jgi:DNA-binding response OmpR family regulator